MAKNQWVVSINTNEDIDGNKTDMLSGQRPLETLRALGNYIGGVANGSKFGTIDVQLSSGSTPTGSSSTLTFASVSAGTHIAVNGVRFIAVSGTPIRANNEFKVGVTNTADAADFVAAFNLSSLATAFLASSVGAVVTIKSQALGLAMNGVVETLGVVASATLTPSNVAATDTFVINGVTFTAEQEMARQTATVSTGNAGDTVTVLGVAFTCVASGATGNQFNKGGSDSATCTNLAAAINASTSPTNVSGGGAPLNTLVTALASTTTLKLRAVASGTGPNAYTLTATGGWTATGATFANGLATSNNKFDYGDTNAQTISEVLRAVAASSSALVNTQVFCTSTATLVTVYALAPGTEGNCVTLSGTGGFSASGARLTGGAWAQNWGAQASGTWTTSSGSGVMGVALNGVAITVTWATSDTATAAALAAAVNASTNALVQGLVYATSAAGVVTITAVNPGAAANAITLATSGAGTGQSVSGARLTGGAAPTQVVLGGTGVSQSATIAGARMAGGTGIAANGGTNANGYTN